MSNLQPDTLIKNPQGCHVVSSVEVPADAAKVWAIVGDFAGFERFIPALSHTEMTGEGVSSLRKKVFKDGNVVVEQLNSRDEQARRMTWTTCLHGQALGFGVQLRPGEAARGRTEAFRTDHRAVLRSDQLRCVGYRVD